MTRVYLDHTEVAGLPEGLLSLDAIIRHLEANSIQRDSVIRQVHLNGQPVIRETQEATEASLRAFLTGSEKVEIFTGSVREISLEAISEAIDYLCRVETVTPSICLSFRTSPTGATYSSLRQLYDGFYWVHLLMERLKSNYGEDLIGCCGGSGGMAGLTSEFRAVLRRLVQAQENDDFVLISDNLEYELLPLVPQWRRTLEAAAEVVRARA